MAPSLISVCETDALVTIELTHAKPQNPMSRQMTLELLEVLRRLAATPPRGLLVWGGAGRSFCVGGDFEDVRRLATFDDVAVYLGEIFDLYIALLRVPCPVVAALDHFAIGQGLQFSLMADWRVATERTQLLMPELKNGVACPLGSLILEHLLGRARMMHLVVGCQPLSAREAHADRLINELASPDELISAARARLATFAAFHPVPFTHTKRIHNERFVSALEAIREGSTQAHAASFNVRAGQPTFDAVLKRATP